MSNKKNTTFRGLRTRQRQNPAREGQRTDEGDNPQSHFGSCRLDGSQSGGFDWERFGSPKPEKGGILKFKKEGRVARRWGEGWRCGEAVGSGGGGRRLKWGEGGVSYIFDLQ